MSQKFVELLIEFSVSSYKSTMKIHMYVFTQPICMDRIWQKVNF